MLILKGNQGKSVIAEILASSHRALTYVYYTESLPFDSYYISSKDYNVDELIDSVKRDLYSNNGNTEILVIYTNLSDNQQIEQLEVFLRKCEHDCVCRFGMLMCQ